MQKQTYKSTLSILIAAILLFGILPISMAQATITITAPTSGTDVQVGDKVLVSGTGASPGSLVKVYWDQAVDTKKLNETYATGAGAFSCYITIPEDVVGDHWIIVDGASVDVDLIPKITLTPETGLKGDTVTVTGKGFAAEKKITITFDGDTMTTTPSEVKTTTKGSFTCTFKVPDKPYASYPVVATDELANSDDATFTIGATITLTPAEGPSGTVVDITGRGFLVPSGTDVTITVNGVTAKEVADIKTKIDQTFAGKFIVPTLNVGTYTVTATAGAYSGTLDFEVTGKTGVKVTPTSGAPGSSITIEGINYTAIADTTVTIDFGPVTGHATLKTNATGGFKGTITVPSIPPSVTPYTITATDANDLVATTSFRVALTTLTVSPSEGPTGTKVLVVGGGYTPGGVDFNVTIDGKLMIDGEGTLLADGNIPTGFTVYVPTVAVGTYTITVMDEEGVTGTASFKVTKKTEIILTPASAPEGYNVTIELNYFTAAAGTNIDIVLYNSTYELVLDGYIKRTPPGTVVPVETNSTGSFPKGWFLVPDLALGNYKINATDDNGLGVWETPFSVVEPVVSVYTGAAEYMRGDFVSFYGKCSFSTSAIINIKDPDGNPWPSAWLSISTKVGDLYMGSTYVILAADAKLGVWNWTATAYGKEITGSFKVVEKPTAIVLAEQIASMNKTINELRDKLVELSEDVGDAADIAGDAKDAATAASTAATSARDAATAASTAASDAKTAATAASTAAQDAKKAAEAAQSTAAGISGAVYGAIALSAVAAIAAIIAVIQLQRKVAG